MSWIGDIKIIRSDGRRDVLRLSDDVELMYDDLLIELVFATTVDQDAPDVDRGFEVGFLCQIETVLINRFEVDDDLDGASGIADIKKNEFSMVPATLDPTLQLDLGIEGSVVDQISNKHFLHGFSPFTDPTLRTFVVLPALFLGRR
jgi:hypothetical protein